MEEAILTVDTLKPLTLNVTGKERNTAVIREKINMDGISGMAQCRFNDTVTLYRKMHRTRKYDKQTTATQIVRALAVLWTSYAT